MELNKKCPDWHKLGIVFLITCMGACSKSESTATSPQIEAPSVVLSGTVVDGPIVDASISVLDANDATVATGLSDASARFSIEIPAGTRYPITLKAESGTDLVTGRTSDFQMHSTLTNPQQTIGNISLLGTVISSAARPLIKN